MARPLQLLSLVLSGARAGALSLQPTFRSCRFINKGPSRQPWALSGRAPRDSDGLSDEECALEDVEDKIQEVIDKERRRKKAVKYHILRRKMTTRGPPERKLTWDAIEEVRYLKQEQPKEWTVERLAEGFSVNKDVILRVLRSKFVPSTERKLKQDTKVMGKLHQPLLPSGAQVEQKKLRPPAGGTEATLSAGSGSSTAVVVGHQMLIPQAQQNAVALNVMTTQVSKQIIDKLQEVNQPTNSTALEEEESEEAWDGQILSEEDIAELMTTIKSTPVVKEGNEVFDVHGNFLYRI